MIDLAALALDNPLFAAAGECARSGFRVYPARPRDKKPLYKGWQRAATTKLEPLGKFWKNTPTANVGIACQGYTVLDADSTRGEDALSDLCLPPTTAVRTRRGVHLYFLGNGPTVAGVLPDVEARGQGSGVLGAGSIHPSGLVYEWEIPPWEVEPITIPRELRELIVAARRKASPEAGVARYYTPGERSRSLLRLAASLRGRFGITDLAAVLHEINRLQCQPPLPTEDVERLARYVNDSVGLSQTWVLDPHGYCNTDSRLSANERIVLRLLCDHAGTDGKCFPGLRRLAELAGIRLKSVHAAVWALEAKGRIEVARRKGRQGNTYTLLPFKQQEPKQHNRLTSVPPSETFSVSATGGAM